MKKKIYFLSALGGSLWGFSFLATALTKQYGLEPVQIQVGRWSVAALFFAVMAAMGKVKLPSQSTGTFKLVFIAMIQSCLSMVLESYGIVMTSSSEASLFVAAMPSVALLLELFFFKRKKNKFAVISILITLLGVTVCTVFSPNFSGEGNRRGYLLMAASVLAGATYTCLVSLVRDEFEPMQITAVMAFSGAVFFNILNFVAGYGMKTYRLMVSDGKIICGILFLGIICSAVCYRILNYVIAGIGPALANNIASGFSTAVGILAGILIAGDIWGWYTVVGVLFIFIGVGMVSKAT